MTNSHHVSFIAQRELKGRFIWVTAHILDEILAASPYSSRSIDRYVVGRSFAACSEERTVERKKRRWDVVKLVETRHNRGPTGQ